MASQVVNVRQAFRARKGYYYVDADFSQIEFRLSAFLAQERAIMEGFLQGNDYYRMVYREMSLGRVALKDVTKTDRQLGKMVALAQNYMQGTKGLARKIRKHIVKEIEADFKHDPAELFLLQTERPDEYEEMIVQRAGVIRNSYWEGMAATHHKIQSTIEKVEKSGGQITNWLGRKKTIPELSSKHKATYNRGKRLVWNYLIQSAAAEWLKIAMLRLANALKGRNARLIMTVHDELLAEFGLEVPVYEAMAIVKEAFEFKVDTDTFQRVGIPNAPLVLPELDKCRDLYPQGLWIPASVSVGFDWGNQHDNVEPKEGVIGSFLQAAEERGIKLDLSPPRKITWGGFFGPIYLEGEAPVSSVDNKTHTPSAAELAGLQVLDAAPVNGFANGHTEKVSVPSRFQFPCLVLDIKGGVEEAQAMLLSALQKQAVGDTWVYLEYLGQTIALPQPVNAPTFLQYTKDAFPVGMSVETYDGDGNAVKSKVRFV